MPWLQEEDAIIPQDGATSHTGYDTPSKHDSAGKEREFDIKDITQPMQSPDLNVIGLGFFVVLKSRVWKEEYRWIGETVEGIGAMLAEYDSEVLDRV